MSDHIAPNIRVLFVGINPGLRSALLGHHFAGHSNRFWKVLYASGLVPEPLTYRDDWRLPAFGLGLTNMVARPTAGIRELTAQEYEAGRTQLLTTIARYQPSVVAVLGLSLATILLGTGRISTRRLPGLQRERLVNSSVFLLLNPSGRNAHYSLADMVKVFRDLREFLLKTVPHSTVHKGGGSQHPR
ncbi:MAG TPA: mismatch-specific DNA-glycosylase [Nitrospiraceae bacterium]|nr:mismatch-specific DNA-glycosylase [Nitrospiraceae bacterium]